MKKYLSIRLITGFLFIMILCIPLLAMAVNNRGLTEVAKDAGLYTEQANIGFLISKIIRVILTFLGFFTVILIIIGGFQWMTAGGNSEAVKKAKEKIANAMIGLILILCSLAISIFVIERLIGDNIGAKEGGGGWFFEK